MDFLVIVHISIAIILILLVLVQDSKGAMGSTFGGGGGGSNTLFGATGVENVLTKSTKVVVVFFAITCILLTRLSSENKDSVLDTEGYRPTEAVPAEAVPAGAVPAEAVPAEAVPESTKQVEGQAPAQEDKSTEKGANKKSTDNSQNKQKSNSKDNVKSDPKKAIDAPPSTEETK